MPTFDGMGYRQPNKQWLRYREKQMELRRRQKDFWERNKS